MSFNNAGTAVVAGSLAGRAAEYVRMSTEHQQYSTENQRDRIRDYATRRGFEIVRTYADEGKSGLRIDGRQALQNLISDVVNGKADFCAILVYDVSRWGRFQDADESAYYEYICRRAGIQVAVLRRAVRERRVTCLHHRQRRQAGDGWRVQPRIVRQGIRRSVPLDRDGLPARRPGRLRPAPRTGRPARPHERRNCVAASIKACKRTA